MSSRPSLLTLAFIGSALLFLCGGVHLFYLRLQAGDVYPEYSSLRSDPLGTRLLYQSLEHMNHVEVSRNLLPVSQLASYPSSAIFFLGTSREGKLFDPADGSADVLIASGSRVVICLRSDDGDTFPSTPDIGTTDPATNKDAQAPRQPNHESRGSPPQSIPRKTRHQAFSERWGFQLRLDKTQGKPQIAAYVGDSARAMPATMPWHGGLSFTTLKTEWKVIYRCLGRPVVIERTFGKGTLVLATDTYLLSNEGLWRDRQPELLSWLIGPYSRLVFDETHLGIRQTSGVMSLVRQYHLEGALVGAILLAGLLIWKKMSSLVPPQPLLGSQPAEIGFDSIQGLVHLLKRNIPPANLLSVCIEQGAHSLTSLGKSPRLGELRNMVSKQLGPQAKPAEIVSLYRRLCAELQPRAAFRAQSSEQAVRLANDASKGDSNL